MTPSTFDIAAGYGELRRPHIAEWFGHRVFPVVSASTSALEDQTAKGCPFLSSAFRSHRPCIKLHREGPSKTGNSEGVCTVSSTSNGPRQDWIVCPVRALDDDLLDKIVRHLYRVPGNDRITLAPVSGLTDEDLAATTLRELDQLRTRVFVYFQNKVPRQHPSGGEIGLPQTSASPKMSFDTTIVELLPAPGRGGTAAKIGKYAVVELQTADTHGTYQHAVAALRNGLDLHRGTFHAQLASNPEWSRRQVEGPNVANVFKRTIYQIAFKFRVTNHDHSAGSVLALPQPVWDSWHRFLGAPRLVTHDDGTQRLLDDQTVHPRNWIYVFDIAERPGPDGGATPVEIRAVIGTDAFTLARAALETAPEKAIDLGVHTKIAANIADRLRRLLPGKIAP